MFPPLGLSIMEIWLSLLLKPHSGMHFLTTCSCVPLWQHLKPVSYLFKKAYKVWLCTLFIYFTSDLIIYIDHFLLNHLIVAAVSITSHNWTLLHIIVWPLYNCYIFYCLVYLICIICSSLEKIMVQHYINHYYYYHYIIIIITITPLQCVKRQQESFSKIAQQVPLSHGPEQHNIRDSWYIVISVNFNTQKTPLSRPHW